MRSITSRQNPVVALASPTVLTRPARVYPRRCSPRPDARDSGHSFEIAAVSSSRLTSDNEEAEVARSLAQAGVEVIQAPDSVFAAMSPVRTPSGLVAIGRRRPTSASEMCAVPDAFVLMAIDVQDPGNVGALMRTAEAGGMTACS